MNTYYVVKVIKSYQTVYMWQDLNRCHLQPPQSENKSGSAHRFNGY